MTAPMDQIRGWNSFQTTAIELNRFAVVLDRTSFLQYESKLIP